jgi:hypothetical protein
MQRQSNAKRLEVLEFKVEGLQALPGQVATLSERVDAVAAQIFELRGEMRAEFSALRQEFRTDIRAVEEGLREELRGAIRAGDEKTREDLRAEIRAGDQETRRQMLVLHEDVISKIALIGEKWNGGGTVGSTGPRPRKPGKR